MTSETRRAVGDLALAVSCGIGAAVLFIGAAGLPPPRFEPLGSAAMPRILGTILIVLSALIAVRAALILRRATAAADVGEGAPTMPLRSGLTFATLVGYVLLLDLARAPFWLATTAFLGAIGLILSGFNWRPAIFYAGLGAALGAALTWVFENFLYISLG